MEFGMKPRVYLMCCVALAMRVGAQPDAPPVMPAPLIVVPASPAAVSTPPGPAPAPSTLVFEPMPAPAPAAWQLPFEDDPEWSWKNLGYGPIEIGSGALAPIGGGVIGGIIGALLPLKGMNEYCAPLVPYTAVGGAAAGTAAGAMLSPIVVVEGLFDTLTGGAFASRPFAWFNVKIPVAAQMQQTFGDAPGGTSQ
jgi:hypothetical protein